MCRKEIFVALTLFLSMVAGEDVVGDTPMWMVEDTGKNVTCLIAQMNVRANFSYQLENKTMKNAIFDVPANAVENKLASSCNVTRDVLNVTWDTGSFELIFARENSTYDLASFKIILNASGIFNDSAANQSITVAYIQNETFKVPSNFSYHCNHEQTLNATINPNDEKAIVLSKVQFEAFKADNSKKFSLAKDCDSNVKPDIVPIAVGLSLIALIIIVLISFIVARRRTQARGYLNIM